MGSGTAEITIGGAGGFVFPLRLIGDSLSFTEFRDAELALMDVDPQTLARTAKRSSRPRCPPRPRSHHASEYLPSFRKNRELTETFIPQRRNYPKVCSQHDEAGLDDLLKRLKAQLRPSLEDGAQTVHSLETGTARVVYGNVPNRGWLGNLPTGLCAEIPCLVGS